MQRNNFKPENTCVLYFSHLSDTDTVFQLSVLTTVSTQFVLFSGYETGFDGNPEPNLQRCIAQLIYSEVSSYPNIVAISTVIHL